MDDFLGRKMIFLFSIPKVIIYAKMFNEFGHKETDEVEPTISTLAQRCLTDANFGLNFLGPAFL
jgi:hypothetical protein